MKSKLDRPAPARDLYTSPLFRKARSYAEITGAPWFVLSAEHGLVTPSTVLRPYDLRLPNTPRDYRRAWGLRVVEQLQDAIGPLPEKIIEVHAGSAYADAIRDRLVAEGAGVVEPLRGMTMGARLAWYGHDDAAQNSVPEVPELVEHRRAPRVLHLPPQSRVGPRGRAERAEIDEGRLTAWMRQYLRLIAIPIDDADALNGLESAVLADLNPPLNLDKMPRSPIRQRLTDLRRQHSRRSRSRQ